MIGFGIDEIQAEYVAEIKLRHLNREYILKRLQDVEQLQKDIAEMEDILAHKSKIKKIIIKELGEVSKKYGKERRSEICFANEIADYEEQEKEIPDYAVTLFFTKEGYFKKITPQALRTSGEQKLKEGDEIVSTVETTNKAELLFFTNKCQVYKSRADDFDMGKASVLGDFVPSKLDMEEGESTVGMVVTLDYSGYVLFFFENGRVAKVSLSAYQTKTNRKKLIKAYCEKFPLSCMMQIAQDKDIVLKSSAGRLLLINTGAVSSKTTKDTQGIVVFTLKKGHKLVGVRDYVEGEFAKPYRYKTKNLPSTGALPSAEDAGEQLTLL